MSLILCCFAAKLSKVWWGIQEQACSFSIKRTSFTCRQNSIGGTWLTKKKKAFSLKIYFPSLTFCTKDARMTQSNSRVTHSAWRSKEREMAATATLLGF